MAGYQASRELFLRIKGSTERQYVIGQRAGLQPAAVTAILRGYYSLDRDDPRVIALAKAVGLPPARAFARRKSPAR
jgi:hypothetical protein